MLLSVSFVFAADADNMTDENLELDGPFEDSLDNLDYKINSSSTEEITLDEDYYCGNSTRTEKINIIGENLTIDGQGHFFDGNASKISTLFTVHGSNVTFKSIKFINWNLNDNLIEWKGFRGAIINCTFIDNYAEYSPILDWTGNFGSMMSCTFINNSAEDTGVINWHGDFGKIEFSNFTDNFALQGGAVYWNGRDGGIYTSVFKNNFAYDDGGAIYWSIHEGTVVSSIFINNTALNGGAIYYSGSNFTVSNTRFENNSAEEEGGALYCEADLDVSSSQFINNNATLGGGIYCFDSSLLTMDDAEFINNSAISGGAAFVENEAFIDNSRFIGNTVNETGGALFLEYDGAVTNSTFTKNSAGTNQSFGGAIYCEEVLVIDSCNFTENSAFYAGAVYVYDDSMILNSSFTLNSAQNGGALCLNNGEIINSTFIENTAAIGGAIWVSGNLTVDGSSFANNTAADGSNNIISMAADVIVNNTESDSQLFVKFVYMFLNVTNVTFGDDVKIAVTLTAPNNDTLNGGTVTVTLNSEKYTANVVNNKATIIIPNMNAGNYSAFGVYNSDDYCGSDNCDFQVLKAAPEITAKSAEYVINYGGKYSITIINSNGNVLPNQKVTFNLNGKSIGSAITNSKGVATIKLTAKILKKAKAGKKNLVIELSNDNCNEVSKIVKITINKEKTKIAAKKKTFTKSVKTKKYVIKLKNSKGKPVKKAKVTLKVNGKTYKAKTTKKGKATFKMTKLNKKGKFKATIKFKANKYYKSSTKKVRITVKG